MEFLVPIDQGHLKGDPEASPTIMELSPPGDPFPYYMVINLVLSPQPLSSTINPMPLVFYVSSSTRTTEFRGFYF